MKFRVENVEKEIKGTKESITYLATKTRQI